MQFKEYLAKESGEYLMLSAASEQQKHRELFVACHSWLWEW